MFAPHEVDKNESRYALPQNRVVISGLKIVFQPDIGPSDGAEASLSLFEVSPQTAVSLSGCSVVASRQANYQKLHLLAKAGYFETGPGLGGARPVLNLESCMVYGLDTVYDQDTNCHSLLINRSQFMDIKGTAFALSPDSQACIESCTFSNCLKSQISICRDSFVPSFAPQKPESLNPLHLRLSQHYPLNDSGGSLSHSGVSNWRPVGSIQGFLEDERDLCTTPKAFCYLRNINFTKNFNPCIEINQESLDYKGKKYLVLKDCCFEQNYQECFLVYKNNKVTLHVDDCKFAKNYGPCFSLQASIGSLVVRCKFKDNLGAHLLCSTDSSVYFTQNLSTRNKSGVKFISTAYNGKIIYIKIIQNRFEEMEGNAVELAPFNDHMQASLQNNIIKDCLNGALINTLRTESLGRSPAIECFDNDVLRCREFGYLLLGSYVSLSLSKDVVKDNCLGAISIQTHNLSPVEPFPSCVNLDTKIPPSILGKIYVNSTVVKLEEESECSLI